MRLRGKKIFIVCSDPGASQTAPFLIQSLKKKGVEVALVAQRSGRYFAGELGIDIIKDREAYSDYRSIKRFIKLERPDFVVTGTSLRDDLERNYINASRLFNIPTLSIIDWWTGFNRRFTHSKTKKLCIPDWVCVVDEVARDMLRRELKDKVKIAVTGNPYFSYVAKSAKRPSDSKKYINEGSNLSDGVSTILFLAEPTEPPMGYNQFEIFKRVAKEVRDIAGPYGRRFNFIIKFHPNGEKPKIYRRYERISNMFLENKCNVRLVKRQYNISMLIDSADYVWGMNTTPLLEAMVRNKLVSSFLHGVDFSGVPFAKKANFCPSADNYSQYHSLITNLLTNEKFAEEAKMKQSKYRVPKEDFGNKICGIIERELSALSIMFKG